MLRVPLRRSPSPAELQAQLQAEVDAAFEDSAVLRVFRRFRQRQMLRIGTNDIIRDRPLEEITRDISRVADVALEVALATALRHVGKRFGQPCTAAGQPVSLRRPRLRQARRRGAELQQRHRPDVRLRRGRRHPRQARSPASATTSSSPGRSARWCACCRPTPTAARPTASTCGCGRRAIAARWPGRWPARCPTTTRSAAPGNGRRSSRSGPWPATCALGERFLQADRAVRLSQISDVRRDQRDQGAEAAHRAEGRPGRRRRHRGQDRPRRHPRHRVHHPVPATPQRRRPARGAPAQHAPGPARPGARRLPDRPGIPRPRRRLPLPAQDRAPAATAVRPADAPAARRRGGAAQAGPAHGLSAPQGATATAHRPIRRASPSCSDYRDKTEPTRRILDHLLHQTFAGEAGSAEPESDLILDPNPDPETIRAVLGRYPFRDVQGAYNNLVAAGPGVVAVSVHAPLPALPGQHRARPAPRRSPTRPTPTWPCVNLEKVTASLGAKTVLWELFSFNPPSLKLYVDLCAWSQFLSEILINNPGMIDELLDSLVLNQPRARRGAAQGAGRPVPRRRGPGADPAQLPGQGAAADRRARHPGQGRRSSETTAELSDLAETILVRAGGPAGGAAGEALRRAVPGGGPTGRAAQPVRAAGAGQARRPRAELPQRPRPDADLRGRRPDRAAAGATRFDRFELTDNFHFFTELAQRIIRADELPRARWAGSTRSTCGCGRRASRAAWCCRWASSAATSRPTPTTGARGGAQLWERQALTRARVVHGDADFGAEVMAAVAEAACALPWRPELADEIVAMRGAAGGQPRRRAT